MKKKCSKCDNEYELSFFYKDSSSKDGHRYNCRACSKKYREENKESQKEYREKNKEKIKEYHKNRKYDPIKSKEYYEENKERLKEKAKEYYEENKESKKAYQSKYQKEHRESRNIYLSERRKKDEKFRLITNVRNLILNSFYNMGYSKNSKTENILGCSFDQLKIYIESKFETWMNWDNRGLYNGEFHYGWDIDHIVPLSEANTIEDLIKLNHFSNLQPLCSKMNRDIKKNKIWQDHITH